MALFPAYEDLTKKSNNVIEESPLGISEFNSFNDLVPVDKIQALKEVKGSSASEIEAELLIDKKHKKKKSKSKSQRKRKDQKSIQSFELSGNENYYVDKKSLKTYLSVQTLNWPAGPKYRTRNTILGLQKFNSKNKVKRYFDGKLAQSSINEECTTLTEEDFDKQSTDMNRIIMTSPTEISNWISLLELQNKAPYKWSKTTMAEKKLDLLNRALLHNIGNDQLYSYYIDIVNATYPSFEVSKIIDKLISKDVTNYSLWRAKILTTQCSMAGCIVPDVLKLYEKCMQKMFQRKQGDDIMLKIFSNCLLFLRQCGLNEQLFALIKLALELNISSIGSKNTIEPNEKDQHTLIEYEEQILKSGLPMNEIWFRIENLRQSFNFLPCPTSFKCTDPQRIIFNEDICNFCYPLTSKENSLYLVLIILRLLKVPFILTTSLRNVLNSKFGDLNYNSDSIEDMVSVTFFIKNHFSNSNRNSKFFQILFDIIKELTVSPTYLNNNIGYEIYRKTLMDIILICAESLAHIDSQKKIILIILWLRLEKMFVIYEQFSNNVSTDYCKNVRLKVKNYLKLEENRNVTNYYTEYALLETEIGDYIKAEKVFINLLSNNTEARNSDNSYVVISYGETLIKRKQFNKALNLFIIYALKMDINNIEQSGHFADTKKLAALNKLNESLNNLVNIEKNVDIMELEQHILPDYLVNLIKIKIFYECLLDYKLNAMANLDKLIKQFSNKNKRHSFLREQIFELYIKILQWPCKSSLISNVLIYDKITEALHEFPENVFILTSCALLKTQPWFKIRSTLNTTKSNLGVVLLVALARHYNFEQENSLEIENDHDSKATTFKIRIINILKSIIDNSDQSTLLQHNPILWRLYLRILVEDLSSFNKTKQYLLRALDQCPWNKSLYIDGTIFAPQETSHLQDLMIEKQLRVYALQEELQILRNDPKLIN